VPIAWAFLVPSNSTEIVPFQRSSVALTVSLPADGHAFGQTAKPSSCDENFQPSSDAWPVPVAATQKVERSCLIWRSSSPVASPTQVCASQLAFQPTLASSPSILIVAVAS